MSPDISHVYLTGKSINRVGFGTARIASDKLPDGTMVAVRGQELQETQLIRNAIGLGINHLDTAAIYGAGYTEEVVGQAIVDLDCKSIFVASKVGFSPQSSEEIVSAAKACLRRLNLKHLDLLYIHNQWPGQSMEPAYRGLAQCLDLGLTRAVGLSNFKLPELQKAVDQHNLPIVAYQARRNVLSHGLTTPELMQFCQEKEIAIVAHTPLGRGAISDTTQNGPISAVVQNHDGSTPAQIALAWLLSNPNIIAIPRSHNVEHLRQNLAALDLILTPNEIAQLNTIGANR